MINREYWGGSGREWSSVVKPVFNQQSRATVVLQSGAALLASPSKLLSPEESHHREAFLRGRHKELYGEREGSLQVKLVGGLLAGSVRTYQEPWHPRSCSWWGVFQVSTRWHCREGWGLSATLRLLPVPSSNSWPSLEARIMAVISCFVFIFKSGF